jgi:hypothetical protein
MPHKRKSHMGGSKAKARFDTLRAQYLAADRAATDEAITQSVKYGTERDARSWAGRGEKSRLEKLEKKRDKIGDAIIDLIIKESPRGESWQSGVPTSYLRRDLPWEDVVRPSSEPLSILPPSAYGWSPADLKRHLGS